VNEPRRDRGANNKRLPVSEAALVAFAAPIAGAQPEVHETLNPNPTRDGQGEGVPMAVPCGQLPGCLPNGFTLDSLLTREQFCIWRGVSLEWLKARIGLLPGMVNESRQNPRVHPRTYLEKSTKVK
jgi:hypothetical protein